jgi:hypothetical protein
MGYDSVTVTKAMKVVDDKKNAATKMRKQHEKMPNRGVLKWREPYYITPEEMTRIWTEVEEQFKELTAALAKELQPTLRTRSRSTSTLPR